MVLIESNLLRVVLDTVFSATNRSMTAEQCVSLIIITLTGFPFRRLSFFFVEPEVILFSPATLESSYSSSIDYPTS